MVGAGFVPLRISSVRRATLRLLASFIPKMPQVSHHTGYASNLHQAGSMKSSAMVRVVFRKQFFFSKGPLAPKVPFWR